MAHTKCIGLLTFVVCCAVLPPQAARAQANGSLAAIDSLIARSRFRDATAALDTWEHAHIDKMASADHAAVLMLHARLTNSADSARGLYIAVSAGYPSSADAPVALLRLGLLAVTDDDSLRAISYFQRIVTNYPTAPVHVDAVAWLAKMKATNRGAKSSSDTDGEYALQVFDDDSARRNGRAESLTTRDILVRILCCT